MSYGVGLRNGVAFALGTIPSLTSGGTLRPSLLLDFLSGSLDPRITFSRGTQAMQYGSNGTLQYAPNNLLTYSNQADNAAWTKSNSFVQTNLLTYSEQFDNAAWTKTNVTVTANAALSPNGTLTADEIVCSANGLAYVEQLIGPYSQANSIVSMYLKASATDRGALVVLWDATDSNSIAELVVTSLSSGGTDAGNGWRRYNISGATLVLGNALSVRIYPDKNATGVASVSRLYAWGAQLVQGSVPGNYQATTSAALPCLYADYNGALRARKLCETAITGTHNISQNATVVGGAIYTDSIYVKAGERTSCRVINYDNGANYAWIYVDLTNGNTLNSGVTGTVSSQSFTVTSAGLGWYRISIVAGLAATTRQLRIDTAVGASENTTGDGSSGIYIADAQLTPGYLPLAVTETTSAAVYGPRFDYNPSSLVTQNLLTYSEQFDNAAWTKITATVATGVTDPNGGLTAATVTANAAFGSIRQVLGASDAAIRVNSIWLRRRTGTGNINFWAPGVVTPLVISTLPSVWTRYSISDATAQTTRTLLVELVANGDAIDIAFAQMNNGSTALPYTATTTAPYTLTTARGLLIEEQRVNLLLQSNTFNVTWTASTNTNVTAAAGTSPEGVVNAWRLYGSNGLVPGGLFQAISKAAAATQYTWSIYAKPAGYNWLQLAVFDGTADGNRYWFNLSTGVLGSTAVIGAGFTGVSATITNIGNGWYRCTLTATSNTAVQYNGYAYPTNGDGVTTAGNAFTDGTFIYGAQLEAGAFATSYIPTVGSTATRNADSASITTLTPWYNTAAGTLFASVSYEAAANGPVGDYNVSISDGTISNIILIGSAGSVSCQLISGGVSSYSQNIGTRPAIGVIQKTAFGYSGVDANQAVNGTLGTTDTTTVVPSAVTKLSIGSRGDNSGYLNGWVGSLRYYPTRLPNASLQSITV